MCKLYPHCQCFNTNPNHTLNTDEQILASYYNLKYRKPTKQFPPVIALCRKGKAPLGTIHNFRTVAHIPRISSSPMQSARSAEHVEDHTARSTFVITYNSGVVLLLLAERRMNLRCSSSSSSSLSSGEISVIGT